MFHNARMTPSVMISFLGAKRHSRQTALALTGPAICTMALALTGPTTRTTARTTARTALDSPRTARTTARALTGPAARTMIRPAARPASHPRTTIFSKLLVRSHKLMQSTSLRVRLLVSSCKPAILAQARLCEMYHNLLVVIIRFSLDFHFPFRDSFGMQTPIVEHITCQTTLPKRQATASDGNKVLHEWPAGKGRVCERME